MKTMMIPNPVAVGELTVFPNGAAHDIPGVSPDVWVGSGTVKSITVLADDDATAGTIRIRVWDTSVGDAGLAQRGGTGSLFVYKMIAGATVFADPVGNPYVFNGPNAQITACRLLMQQTYDMTPDAKLILPDLDIVCFRGMAISFQGTGAGSKRIQIGYDPDVNGATRKRAHTAQIPMGGNPAL